MSKPNFKSEQGHYLLKPIFFETSPSDKSRVVYTLKDDDHEGYPSLKRLYIEAEDPTEYDFANNHLHNYRHWKKLTECGWFQDHLQEWREELELRLRAKAFNNIKELASKGVHPQHYQASKFLADRGWIEKEKSQTGPKTKAKIREEAKKLQKDNVEILDDWKRIRKDA